MQGFGALLIIWGILDYIMGESGTDVYYDWLVQAQQTLLLLVEPLELLQV